MPTLQKEYGPGQREKVTLLVPSMFVHRPATAWFDYSPEFASEVPPRQVDRDKLFPFRPRKTSRLLFRQDKNINCIAQALRRAGFGKLNRGGSWNFIWTCHLSPKRLAKLEPYQKCNHFPGSWFLGRKDHLCRNLSAMSRMFGAEYDICPKTYLLPADAKMLEREFESRKAAAPRGCPPVYIRKPVANAEGRGMLGGEVEGQATERLIPVAWSE